MKAGESLNRSQRDRLAFEAEFLRLFLEEGPQFDRRPLIKRFVVESGASQSSCYRWAQAMTGRAGQEYARQVREAAEARAAEPEPARSLELAVQAQLPIIAAAEAMPPQAVVDIMGELRGCLVIAKELVGHARHAETGNVRNSKLMLAATDTIRRTIETMARVNDSLEQTRQLEAFHTAIYEMLREEAPQTAERVLMRMRQLNATWGAHLDGGGPTIDA